jgi:hypothetical protein
MKFIIAMLWITKSVLANEPGAPLPVPPIVPHPSIAPHQTAHAPTPSRMVTVPPLAPPRTHTTAISNVPNTHVGSSILSSSSSSSTHSIREKEKPRTNISFNSTQTSQKFDEKRRIAYHSFSSSPNSVTGSILEPQRDHLWSHQHPHAPHFEKTRLRLPIKNHHSFATNNNANNNSNNNNDNNDDDSVGPPVWYTPLAGPPLVQGNYSSDPEDDEDGPPPFRGPPPPQSLVVKNILDERPNLEIDADTAPPLAVMTPQVVLLPLPRRPTVQRRLPQVPTDSSATNGGDSAQNNFESQAQNESAFESTEDLEKYMKDSVEMLPDEFKNNYVKSVRQMCVQLGLQLSKEAKRTINVSVGQLRVTDFDVAVDPETGKDVFDTKGLVPFEGKYRPFTAKLNYRE